MANAKKNLTWQAMNAGMPPQRKKQRGVPGNSAFKKYMMLLFILAFLLFMSCDLFLYINDTFLNSAASRPVSPAVTSSTTHVYENENNIVVRPPRPIPTHYKRPDFEAGIVFPQWTPDGYATNWQQQLPMIQQQTG